MRLYTSIHKRCNELILIFKQSDQLKHHDETLIPKHKSYISSQQLYPYFLENEFTK